MRRQPPSDDITTQPVSLRALARTQGRSSRQGITANVLDEVRSLSTASGVVAQARDDYLKAEFQSLKDLLSRQATQSDLSRQLALVLEDNDQKQALAWLVPTERQRVSSRFHTTLYRSREL